MFVFRLDGIGQSNNAWIGFLVISTVTGHCPQKPVGRAVQPKADARNSSDVTKESMYVLVVVTDDMSIVAGLVELVLFG